MINNSSNMLCLGKCAKFLNSYKFGSRLVIQQFPVYTILKIRSFPRCTKGILSSWIICAHIMSKRSRPFCRGLVWNYCTCQPTALIWIQSKICGLKSRRFFASWKLGCRPCFHLASLKLSHWSVHRTALLAFLPLVFLAISLVCYKWHWHLMGALFLLFVEYWRLSKADIAATMHR